MKKIFILSACLLLCITGCAGSKKQELSLSDIQSDSAGYHYKDVEWGSSMEEVSTQLGISFTQQPLEYADGSLEYGADDVYEYGALPVKASFVFLENQLYEIDFLLYPDENAQKIFEEIGNQLTAACGSVEVTENDTEVEEFNTTIHTAYCTWENTVESYKTGLSLLLTSQNSAQDSVRISLVNEKYSPRGKYIFYQ